MSEPRHRCEWCGHLSSPRPTQRNSVNALNIVWQRTQREDAYVGVFGHLDNKIMLSTMKPYDSELLRFASITRYFGIKQRFLLNRTSAAELSDILRHFADTGELPPSELEKLTREFENKALPQQTQDSPGSPRRDELSPSRQATPSVSPFAGRLGVSMPIRWRELPPFRTVRQIAMHHDSGHRREVLDILRH